MDAGSRSSATALLLTLALAATAAAADAAPGSTTNAAPSVFLGRARPAPLTTSPEDRPFPITTWLAALPTAGVSVGFPLELSARAGLIVGHDSGFQYSEIIGVVIEGEIGIEGYGASLGAKWRTHRFPLYGLALKARWLQLRDDPWLVGEPDGEYAGAEVEGTFLAFQVRVGGYVPRDRGDGDDPFVAVAVGFGL